MRLSFYAAAAAALLASAAQAGPAITGEYVESRSANVFVGACHHEGEIQTAGRNAVLAWNIATGEYDGVSLDGVRVVAVVAADKHLSFEDARRRSVIYVDRSATDAQRDAVSALLRERAAHALGTVTAVQSAPIHFGSTEDQYRVIVTGVATMQIQKSPAELCCKQPYEVWGKPFVPVANARTGYCIGVEFRDATLLEAWRATDQNNAFFGEFAL